MLSSFFVGISLVKAETITTKYTGDGVQGNYLGTDYYHLATTDNQDLFCLNRGLDYIAGEYTLQETLTSASNPYVCAVIKMGRNNNGSLPRNKLQEALWDAENGSSTYTDCSFITAQDAYCTPKSVKESYSTESELKTKANNPVLYFNPRKSNLNLSDDGEYFVSKKLTIVGPTNSGDYTLDISGLPSTTKISSTSDCSVDAESNPLEFYVCIPSDTNFTKTKFTIKASRTKTVEDVYEYYHVITYKTQTCYKKRTAESASIKVYWREGTGYLGQTNQRLGLPSYTLSTGGESYTQTPEDDRLPDTVTVPREVTVTDQINLHVLFEPKEVIISKKDITGENELVGAHIVIKDSNDEIVEEFDSEEEPHTFMLDSGRYKLIETAAPEGYDRLETVFEFEVLNDETISLISPKNSEEAKIKDNKITIYNTPTRIDIPDTGKNSVILYVAGLILIISGVLSSSIIIKKVKKEN